MPIQTLEVVGRELGSDFPEWIGSRTPKVQMEILEAAPEEFQKYCYMHKTLSRVTVLALGIDGRSPIKITDRRSHANH